MSKRKKQYEETPRSSYFLVPALLVFIAVFQMYLAHFQELSPWKGGGFGMFSVVDSPGMRFLNVQALDQNGNPILIETDSLMTSQRKKFLQSIPSNRELKHLADALMEEEYLPTGSPALSAIQSFSRQNPEIAIPSSLSGQEDWPVYRVKKATDPEIPGEHALRLKALRVGFWRIRFDARTHRVFSEPLLTSIERGTWR